MAEVPQETTSGGDFFSDEEFYRTHWGNFSKVLSEMEDNNEKAALCYGYISELEKFFVAMKDRPLSAPVVVAMRKIEASIRNYLFEL